MLYSLVSVLSVLTVAFAGPSPPAGALVVGKGGQYTSVQKAVDAAGSGKTIFIQAGTYKEQVFIPPNKSNITIIGASDSPDSYRGNKVTITNNLSQDKGLNNDKTGTMRAHGNNIKVYNVNLVNTRGKGSQAVALSAYGTKQAYYGCQFKGFQDTLLSEKGQHYFSKSLIEGATDFIFGQNAQSWFEKCDIKVTAPGYITANGRNSANNPSYYVLNKCNVDGGSGLNGKTYLGRPWREYSRVVFQNSKLGAVVNSAGWTQWGKDKPNTAHVYYGEFANSGPGSTGSRAKFSKKLGSAVSINSILGSSSWLDSKWL